MMRIRKGDDRGFADHGWLRSHHTFSFADYHDPAQMGFGNLRVINEDRIAPGTGFGTHGHRDMEIISVVLAGALAHRDSMGHGSTLRPGELQRMTAGTGVMHSEFNPDATAATHFLQIWIQPRARGLKPAYEQRRFDPAGRAGRLQCVAAPTPDLGADIAADSADQPLALQADARLWLGDFDGAQACVHPLAPGRRAWLQVLSGSIAAQGHRLQAGDGAAFESETELRLDGGEAAQVLLFELP